MEAILPRVVVQDPHPEAPGSARHGLADPAEADDADRRSVDVGSHQEHRAPRLPVAGADVTVPFDEPPGGGHQQAPGEVRGWLREHAGGVADRDSARGAGWDVDVVEADREVADDLQLRAGAVEELVVDVVGEERQDAFAAFDRAQQRVARGWELVLPDLRVACLADEIQALVRDDPRDEDLRTHQTRSACATVKRSRQLAQRAVRRWLECVRAPRPDSRGSWRTRSGCGFALRSRRP